MLADGCAVPVVVVHAVAVLCAVDGARARWEGPSCVRW